MLAYFLPGAVGTLVLVFAVGFLVHLLMDQLSYVFGIKRLRPALIQERVGTIAARDRRPFS